MDNSISNAQQRIGYAARVNPLRRLVNRISQLSPLSWGTDLRLPIGGRNTISALEARYTSGIMAVEQRVIGGFSHALILTERMQRDGTWEAEPHPEFEKLRASPLNSHDFKSIVAQVAVDGLLDGMGYSRMLGVRRVEGLQYLPSIHTKPQYEGNTAQVERYRVTGGRVRGTYGRDELVIVQRGIDPQSPAEGLSLVEALRDVAAADRRAMRGMNSMIHNLTARHPIIQPSAEDQTWTEQQRRAVQETLEPLMTGDNVGRPVVLRDRLELQMNGAAPATFDVSPLVMALEARIAAVTGWPPIVVGYLVGTRYGQARANLEYARRLAVETVLVPLGDDIAEALTKSLLPRLRSEGDWRIRFDWSSHPALQADTRQQGLRLAQLVDRGIVSPRQAAEEMGYEWDPEGIAEGLALVARATRAGASEGAASGEEGSAGGEVRLSGLSGL